MSDYFDEALARARGWSGPLDGRLEIIREAGRICAPDYFAILEPYLRRLDGAEIGAAAPQVGQPFPDFALPDDQGRIWTLAELLSDGPAVVAFHRGGWCEFCQIGLLALAEAHPRIAAAGGRLVGVSPQRAFWAERHRQGAGASFPMLADIDCAVALGLGIAIRMDDGLAAMLEGYGIDLVEMNGDEGRRLPIPATFVIGRDGRVADRYVDGDFRRRMEPEAIIQAVAAASASA